ncbi:MAG TPA: choice-of-anchor D domain-containing protein, partial [Solirubrobacterales bacterium]|nr:choice-of-anchor D domain-containing protein [Solirubrobacterales bacterium]
MFSPRSKSKPARMRSAALHLIVALALLALPAAAAAEPAPGELPQLAFEPGSHDFGLLEANRANGEATLQLRNVGAVPAPIYSLEVTGPDSWAFSSNGNGCFNHPLEPGESCSVQVYFYPQDTRAFSAQLRATTEGNVSASAELSGEGGRATLAAVTDPTNFGSVRVGSGAVVRTIDLVNKGNLPGGFFIAVISGGAVGSFHLLDENCTGVMLSPDAHCNVQVSFAPLGTGAKTARLFLVGDGDGGTQITLSGVGLEPEPPPALAAAAGTATAPAGKPRRKHRA